MATVAAVILAASCGGPFKGVAGVGASSERLPFGLPPEIHSGAFNSGHVQGIVLDGKGNVYMSFTDMIVKTDLDGNLIGTVTGLLGHLGCLDYNPADGLVYGSLEYKDDIIGQGILERNSSSLKYRNTFYIAMIDGDKIVREGMDAGEDGVVRCVALPMVAADYEAKVKIGEKVFEHRLGCSGIDGVSFGPDFGKAHSNGRNFLTVAYGIYSETDREDNDYQVLLQFNTKKWAKRWARPLKTGDLHRRGPKRARKTFYAYTGNTSWGVQNLEYDPWTGYWLMAVYKGKKENFPNYSLFAVDGAARPVKKNLKGVPYIRKGLVVPLEGTMEGEAPDDSIHGWMFPYGSTGIHSFGNGRYYISENSRDKDNNLESTTLRLYRWTGVDEGPFESVLRTP